jgi:hypothetical protein
VILKRKPKPPRMGVREQERREFPKHQAFVRKQPCVVPGCKAWVIRFCHVREGLPLWARGWGSIKPHDAYGYPGCDLHHKEQHDTGEITFARKYGIDLHRIARSMAERSPVPEIRERAKDMPT